MAKKSMTKKGGCYGGGGCGKLGGRRKTRGRRLRGGMYGATEPIAAGAMGWGGAYTGAVGAGGEPIPDPTLTGTPSAGSYTGIGGRRRGSRKTAKKGKKGSKKTRKYRMRGGSTPNMVSAMKAGYGFNGTGAGGLADAVSAPTSGGNAF